MNVFEYMEGTPKPLVKPVVTVRRTTTSKYLFYILARHYASLFRKKPNFVVYSKSEASMVKGLMEEIPLFGTQDLFVLEGFPYSFVADLTLPKGVHVVAEVEDGELDAPQYSYRFRRDILRTLLLQLNLRIPLRDLVSLDWGSIRDYPEIEVLLRKAQAGAWGLSKIEEALKDTTTGNILLMLKKGDSVDLLKLKSKYAESWLPRHLVKLVPQLATYRALVAMGQPGKSIAESLDIYNFKLRELEEAAKAVTMDDLSVLGQRLLMLDRVAMKSPRLASDLLVLRSGISIKR